MERLNNRVLNNIYAPGLPTYGIDGASGERGENGTAFYFTTYNLEFGSSVENEMNDVLIKINQNKILSSYVNKTLERKYNVGDIVIDSNGYSYSIYKTTSNAFALKYILRLNIDDSYNYFQKEGNRVVLTEKGLDLFNEFLTDEESSVSSSTYPLRIFSTKQDSLTGNYNILSMTSQSLLEDNDMKYLNIFYNKEDDSFHFDTTSHIVLDSSCIMFSQSDDTETFSDYYKIEPYADPLGMLHKTYSSVTYSVDDTECKLTLNGIKSNYSNIDIVPDYVKVRTTSSDEYILIVDRASENIDTDNQKISVDLNNITEEEISFVSIIKGVEIYIKKENE